ncbi:hypothetical protein Tco_1469328 [Tanacetum coccineum]
MKVNGTTNFNALAETKGSANVMPYEIYKLLNFGKASYLDVKLKMANNSYSKVMGLSLGRVEQLLIKDPFNFGRLDARARFPDLSNRYTEIEQGNARRDPMQARIAYQIWIMLATQYAQANQYHRPDIT